jgi:hypothetical protein
MDRAGTSTTNCGHWRSTSQQGFPSTWRAGTVIDMLKYDLGKLQVGSEASELGEHSSTDQPKLLDIRRSLRGKA